MKKLYRTQETNELKLSRFSFVKVLSLAAAATFLSNITPVFSANPDFRNTFLEGVKSALVSYPQSIISVNSLNASDDYANFLTKILSSASDNNSIMKDGNKLSKNTLNIEGQYKKSLISSRSFVVDSFADQQLAQNDENTEIINVSSFSQNNPITKMTRSASMERGNADAGNVILGDGVSTKTTTSVIIGSKVTAQLDANDPEKTPLAASVAIGANSHIHRGGSVAIGADTETLRNDGVAIGRFARVEQDAGTALGFSTKALKNGSVALGANSVADRDAGVFGYTSLLQGPAKNTKAHWKSTRGAVSVGDPTQGITRQIIGVAAGSDPTDAVNVIQLKDLESLVRSGGWKLSVDGKNAETVIMDSGVDFSTGSTNLTITKGEKDNKVKFDLAKEIAVNKVTTGNNILDATGLVISGGPKITTGGIDAGSKKITNVAKGTENTDAVNFAQLKEIKEQVAASSFIKQDLTTEHISIGKDTGGDKIDIANNKDEKRTLTGIKGGALLEDSNEAVTGSQLFTTNQNVATVATNIAKSFGGGASYKDGVWTAPSFTVKSIKGDGNSEDKVYPDVASALSGVGTSITNVQNKLTEQVNNVVTKVESESFVQQEQETNRLTIGAKTEGSEINIANKNGEARTLSGVGEAKNDNDAVNKRQLDSNIENVNNNLTNKFNELTQNITNITQEVQGDALLWDKTKGAFVATHGDNKENSKLTSLKNGDITAASSDAIAGNQLYALGDSVAKTLGGNASYENGTWTSPTFKFKSVSEDGTKVEDKEYSTVAAAFAGVGLSFENLQKEFTQSNTEVTDNIKQNALLWSDEDSAYVALHGQGGKRSKSKLKLLLDGDISEGSSEAITGNQLYSLNKTLAMYLGGGARYEGGAWHAPEFKVARFNADGSLSDKKNYNDVAGAFEGVSESMTLINDRIKEVSSNIDTNSLHWNEDAGSYDARYKGVSSKITNVLGGKVEKGSQEVVNGGQLWETNEKVNEVDHKVDKLDQHVKDIETAVIDGAVNYDKDAEGKKTNSITLVGGNDSEPVLIDNVGDGKIETGSKEAVNGGQLHDYTEEQMKIVLDDAKKYTADQVSGLINDGFNESKSYTDMKFEALNYAIEDVRKEARQAAAVGLAVSNLSYDDTPGKLSFSFGSGLWRSQSAFAIGAGYMSESGKIRSNLSVTSSGGQWGVGAGFRVTLN
ncbi:Vomp family autotransporter [Bartonella sp. AD328YNZD]|uniref:Vomp family autotransporter n=1 Tax=Bartonella sp. AD328YNZD TaxID=3243464 RepID=UPI0035CF80B8